MDILRQVVATQPSIEELSLESKGIESLDQLMPYFRQLHRLRMLKLANNRIQQLPQDMSELHQLEYLDLSHNPIKGIGYVLRGLSTLVNLKHLYIDLPYELEEDEIIVSLQSLESFNGTPLTDNGEDLEASDWDDSPHGNRGTLNSNTYSQMGNPALGQRTNAPIPNWGTQRPTNSIPVQFDHFDVHNKYMQTAPSPNTAYNGQTNNVNWRNSDMEAVRRLYAAANAVAGRPTDAGEFDKYTSNVVAHLSNVLQGEEDPYNREAEILKAKQLMYEYCFEEIARSAYSYDPNLSNVLNTLYKTYSDLLENYKKLVKQMKSNHDQTIDELKSELQRATQELDSIIPQKIDPTSSKSWEKERETLVQENNWLRSENERLLNRRPKANYSDYMENQPSLSSSRHKSNAGGYADATSESMSQYSAPSRAVDVHASSNTPKPPDGNKSRPVPGRFLTLRQLKDIIEDIYNSKGKFDIKCSESHLPRETMEQHLYTYLNQKYGLKNLILDWAQSIIAAVRRYSAEDNDVAVFGKILRNEIDEEFRFVQRQLKETVHDLLKVYLRGKYPNKSDEDINLVLKKRVQGNVQEEEWVDIIKYMYNAEDAVSIIVKVKEVIKILASNNVSPKPIKGKGRPEQNTIPYVDFLKVLLDFQLVGHEKFLAKFVRLFRQYDSDKNGILNEAEFRGLLRAIDPNKSDDEINQLLDLIDPHNNQLINFSECVTFLSSELVALMSERIAS